MRPILVAPRGLSANEISQLLSRGVSDFLLPPYRAEDIIPRLRRLLPLPCRTDPTIARIRAAVGLRQIIGESPALLSEMKKLPRIAKCDATVLICGESGTGKEMFARAIHYLSSRADKPFVPVNCGAIPEQLVESELFGHYRGAFTGAVQDRLGLLAEAEGGTLLLDEVEALPFPSQVKLLRFLQEGEFRPIGRPGLTRGNVRVIAASNVDLNQMIQTGKFRADLYYRLDVLRLTLPPLRERRCDLPLLSRHLLEKQALTLGLVVKPLTASAQQCLATYSWPGNVRELENVLARALVLSEGTQIEIADLGLPGHREQPDGESFQMLKTRLIEDFERDYLRGMLDQCGGNITRAAQAANKNRRAFGSVATFPILRKNSRFRDSAGNLSH